VSRPHRPGALPRPFSVAAKIGSSLLCRDRAKRSAFEARAILHYLDTDLRKIQHG
jgi:hypothetical protein